VPSNSDAPKRVIVTGSSSGIGHAIAHALHNAGWIVEGVDKVASDAPFTTHLLDLSDAAALEVWLASRTRPAPAAWVQAAGFMRTGSLQELAPEDGEAMWRIHVDATTRMARALLPAMAQAGAGRVVLIGSRVSHGLAGRSLYAASKAALATLARSWAAEVVTQGVTINVISPAATATAMSADAARGSSAVRTPPIGRLITPQEIAALTLFLLSPNAAAITGQDIAVCGGASLPR
jgi:3-oxoacyl-[acyl-carrier protein] reductase